jgi:hypothetical protein
MRIHAQSQLFGCDLCRRWFTIVLQYERVLISRRSLYVCSAGLRLPLPVAHIRPPRACSAVTWRPRGRQMHSCHGEKYAIRH